jgi:DNA-binding HxlR family transcriptional regulator
MEITVSPPASSLPDSYAEISGSCDSANRALESCRAREVMSLIGDKWSMAVVYLLGAHGTQRFSDLRRHLGAISQRMLTVTLRNLERDGLVKRQIYPEVPPRVEYTLTPLGGTLRDIVWPLIQWADRNLEAIDAARERYDAANAAT